MSVLERRRIIKHGRTSGDAVDETLCVVDFDFWMLFCFLSDASCFLSILFRSVSFLVSLRRLLVVRSAVRWICCSVRSVARAPIGSHLLSSFGCSSPAGVGALSSMRASGTRLAPSLPRRGVFFFSAIGRRVTSSVKNGPSALAALGTWLVCIVRGRWPFVANLLDGHSSGIPRVFFGGLATAKHWLRADRSERCGFFAFAPVVVVLIIGGRNPNDLLVSPFRRPFGFVEKYFLPVLHFPRGSHPVLFRRVCGEVWGEGDTKKPGS